MKVLGTYLSFFLLYEIPWIIATYLLSHTLSPAAYGMGMLLLSGLELMAVLCSVGMDRVFLRYFYEAAYRDQTSILLYKCLFVVGVSIFIFSAISAFFTHDLAQLFHINGWLIWWLAIIGVTVFIVEIFASLISRVYEKPVLYSVGQLVQQSTFLISVIILLWLGKKNSLVIIDSQIIALGACGVTLIFLYRQCWRWPKKFFIHLEHKEIKTLFYYGFPMTLSSSLTWFFFNADKYFLLKWSGAYELGIYTAAIVLSLPMQALRSVFMLAWAPRCNQLVVETPLKGQKICHDTFHQVLWCATATASLLLLSKSFLILWLGNAFHAAENIFGWLLLSIYFLVLSDIVTTGIFKSKKTVWDMMISVTCLLINVSACYYLIPRFGAQGAAVASTLSFGVFFLLKYAIGFYYYPFKIFHWKLFLYTIYFCFVIQLSYLNHFEWQLSTHIIFLIISCWWERVWMMSYFSTSYFLRDN